MCSKWVKRWGTIFSRPCPKGVCHNVALHSERHSWQSAAPMACISKRQVPLFDDVTQGPRGHRRHPLDHMKFSCMCVAYEMKKWGLLHIQIGNGEKETLDFPIRIWNGGGYRTNESELLDLQPDTSTSKDLSQNGYGGQFELPTH